ncbi:MAG: 2,3-bisphosphoglycerate-independent phosphoglycerate mutase [Pseudomonadota bacterium]
MPKPVMLMILDGWGWREETEANAVRLGNTPNFDRLWQTCPHAFLTTCGPAVGLPEGQMGNSEVGHLNIGAGRVVKQELPRIDDAVTDGSFAKAVSDSGFIDALKQSGGTAHLMGLISPGGVHAHQRHALAAAKILASEGVPVALHVFTDGRDTPPRSARDFVSEVADALPDGAQIATVSGRYFAMDRDNRWDRVEKAFRAIAGGEGANAGSAVEAIEDAYAHNVSDEFIVPAAINGYGGMQDGDGVFFLNFRGDRAREILSALLLDDFDGFERTAPKFASAIGMVSYGGALDHVMKTLFAPQSLADGLAETVAKAGLAQIHLAETEKYPHVTYFLNGGREAPFEGEERVLIPSPKVATYDLQPEMSAPELTEALLAAIRGGKYDLIVVNYANPDMVGHTGDLAAAIKAVETVDGALGEVTKAMAEAGGAFIVTADHGNCETMVDPQTGGPHTAHTLNVVPVIAVGTDAAKLHDGKLCDLAPTLLAMMGLEQPAAMTGRSLME